MANTRQSTKRARQALVHQDRNQMNRSSAKSAVHDLLEAMKTKDVAKVKTAYAQAIRALSKTASKGAIPRGRAARKTSRITLLVKKTMPAVFAPQK